MVSSVWSSSAADIFNSEYLRMVFRRRYPEGSVLESRTLCRMNTEIYQISVRPLNDLKYIANFWNILILCSISEWNVNNFVEMIETTPARNLLCSNQIVSMEKYNYCPCPTGCQPVQLLICLCFVFDALLQSIDGVPRVHHGNAADQMIWPCEHQSCAHARMHSIGNELWYQNTQ